MRLIDGDKLISEVKSNPLITDSVKTYVEASVNAQPTVGTVPDICCEDCKHRPKKSAQYKTGFDLDFPDDKCPCKCEDGYYSWYPADNWYCANAEREDND